MMVKLIFLISVIQILAAVFIVKGGKAGKLGDLILSIIVLFFFSLFLGLRGPHSGTDTYSYIEYFNSIRVGEKPHFYFPLGFHFYTYIVSLITNVRFYIFSLTLLQIFILYISSYFLGIKNLSLTIVIFISFLPGLDLLTNALRNGFSLNLGLLIFVCTCIIQRKKIAVNFLPILFHHSYIVISLISIVLERLNNKTFRILLFMLSVVFFILWSAVSVHGLGAFLYPYRSGFSVFSKLVRYTLLSKDIFSTSVKTYFLFTSVSFSFIFFYFEANYSKVRYDTKANRLATASIILQFFYALFYFVNFSYRFMYLGYPTQVILTGYLIDKYSVKGIERFIMFLFFLINIFICYSTNTFSGYKLFYGF